jgi:(p)ppGpp synthase/HD superfamily hydrolase
LGPRFHEALEYAATLHAEQKRKGTEIPYIVHPMSVAAADKLHNARSILLELRREGSSVWDRFRGGKEGTLWYYRTAARVFLEARKGPLERELKRVVTQLERLATRSL